VVGDAQLSVFHQLPLCSVRVQAVVCPESATKESDTTVFGDLSFQKLDRGISCSFSKRVNRVGPDSSVSLVIPGNVEDRNWPVAKHVERLHTSTDVTSQHKKVCAMRGRDGWSTWEQVFQVLDVQV
jgi:hypothetical protein